MKNFETELQALQQKKAQLLEIVAISQKNGTDYDRYLVQIEKYDKAIVALKHYKTTPELMDIRAEHIESEELVKKSHNDIRELNRKMDHLFSVLEEPATN